MGECQRFISNQAMLRMYDKLVFLSAFVTISPRAISNGTLINDGRTGETISMFLRRLQQLGMGMIKSYCFCMVTYVLVRST